MVRDYVETLLDVDASDAEVVPELAGSRAVAGCVWRGLREVRWTASVGLTGPSIA
ncbi:hypothetical protein BH23ACT10_BH23ACT10_12310 [soil metagenome]